MDHQFMGLAPEDLPAESNLVKTVTLIRWNWEGRCSASSITGCWFFCWYCLPSPVTVGFLALLGFPRWQTRAPSDLFFLCEPGAKDLYIHGGPGWKAEDPQWGFWIWGSAFWNLFSLTPLALADTMFSRGPSVLALGPAGFPRAGSSSSSRQCPDSVEGSWLPAPYVNGSFHHPWCSSPSFPGISLLLFGNE